MVTFKRRLYQLILRLHPAAFRNRFAREMSLDFEDALATYGFPRLLADATRSLLRQWVSAPFAAPQQPAPISSHPFLAGQYIVLEGDALTPFELLRGSLLFAVMLCALSFALNHGGNYIHSGQNIGLSGGAGSLSQPTSASHAASHASAPDSSQTLAIQTSSLPSRYGVADRNGHTIYTNPAAPISYPQAESLKEFLARCAIISAIVWVTSFLTRRTRRLGARVAFVSLGLSLLAVFAVLPLYLAITSAHAARLPSDNSHLHFKSATIQLRQDAPAERSAPVGPDLSSVSEDLVHIDSPIRTLLAQVSNVPRDAIIGGPAWLDTDTYDITARVDPATLASIRQLPPHLQSSQERLMEQELLVDRFHLKLHVESRQPDVAARATTSKPIQILVIDSIERPSEN